MNYRPSPFAGLPPVTKNLLIINAIFLLATWVAENTFGINLNTYLGLHLPSSELFNPAQLGTYMFMHGGFMHLFFNMFAVFMFGRVLEVYWGPKKFFTFYIITGIGAAAINIGANYIDYFSTLSQLSDQQYQIVMEKGAEAMRNYQNFTDPLMGKFNKILNGPTVGASGAVFGILLAFGMLFPNTELMLLFPPIPLKAKYFVIIYGVVELFMGVANFSFDNVAHFAHLGGMAFGFILIKYWQKKGV
ncbi:rhomboid family intramembrane serine protease [Carboxylicivirga linearis]|uniref:Rhomboid family intramembrane serine protease n=1 Tax=Carboxylicivirga linearis TaxID=1628157 RepID=A0ABS5JP38_9BACT|nr:rhomboid family intramembrane serine protease [Carboxylicivirga linearis]MBS2096679.1 rhomboid family intramembrane serine protease [Carboxylicivirga linearis]